MQTFKPGDTKKALTITLIHHEGYTQEKDFYVLLKNPVGKAELGEPNLARITIIDDDGNDLDLCEKYIVTGLQITVGRWTLTDQNLLMSVVAEPKGQLLELSESSMRDCSHLEQPDDCEYGSLS